MASNDHSKYKNLFVKTGIQVILVFRYSEGGKDHLCIIKKIKFRILLKYKIYFDGIFQLIPVLLIIICIFELLNNLRFF